MIFLLNCIIKVSVILSVSLVAARLLKRQSAALRHCVLTAGILSAAVTPGLSLLFPSWDVKLPVSPTSTFPSASQQSIDSEPQYFPGLKLETASNPLRPVPPASAKVSETFSVSEDQSHHSAIPSQTRSINVRSILQSPWLGGAVEFIWSGGILIALGILLTGSLRLAWLARHSSPIISGPWFAALQNIAGRYELSSLPRLLRSSNRSLLVTWGWRRPKLLLPAGSEFWPADRIQAVLSHELAHIRRSDWIVQMTAEILRSVYWFNPILWMTGKTLRGESEQACDDAAMNSGIGGSEYAEHLLEVVRSLRQPYAAWSHALSMAYPSTLERRFSAILNPTLNRNALTRLPLAATLGAFLLLTLPLSMARGTAVQTVPVAGALRNIAAMVAAVAVAPAEPAQANVGAAISDSEFGVVQGTIRRSDESATVPEVQITLEGGPADPKAVQTLIQGLSIARGIVFNPKRIGTVDEVVRDLTDQAGAQGVGPGFPAFDDAVASFRATNAARFVAESDMDGRFTIKDVPSGQYTIHVEREGFFDLSARSGNPAKVTVTPQQTVTATVSLTPGGVISGHVRDISGEPMQNVGVQIFAMAYQNGFPVLRGTIQKLTDDHGAYRLFWLAPGDYYIAVNPGGSPTEAAMLRTMYPGTLDIARATPVSVRAGDLVSGIDIQMSSSSLPKISGKVTSTIPADETAQQASLYNAQLAQPTLMLVGRDPSRPDIGAGTARTIGNVTLKDGTGNFEVPGILPGSYDLYIRIPQSNAGGGAGFAFAKVPIDVKNENINGISITVNHLVNVTGSVTLDGKVYGSPQVRLQLQPDGSGVKLGGYQSVGQRAVSPNSEGAFSLVGVPPGPFRLDMGPGLPNDLYLADVHQGGISVFDSGIEITSEKPSSLQVVLSSGAGTVEGTALDAAGKPLPGASIVLAPMMARRQNRALYHTATADANGKFVVHNIAPGRYQLFAWQQNIPAGAHLNASFLAAFENRSRIVNVLAKSTLTEEISAVPLQ